MSRSHHSGCPGGRGCYVCGDAGENRRAREAAWHASDETQLPAELEDEGPEYCGPYCGCGEDDEAIEKHVAPHQVELRAPIGEIAHIPDTGIAITESNESDDDV